MLNTEWNRKDRNPRDTIEFITGILSDIGLHIQVMEQHASAEALFSMNIEAVELPGIFSNGKGITYDYALASALGEYMERLQTGQLLHQLYERMDTEKVKPFYTQLNLEELKVIFAPIMQESELENIWSRYKDYLSESEYVHINSGKKVWMPERLVMFLCGSNGTCAGNSPYEAMSQGLSEIFERYVLRQIYYGDYAKIDFPVISKEAIEDMEATKMLKLVEQKGYEWEVKDLTLGNSMPVLGLLVLNKARTKYSFSLASDVSFDICLQRCVTEMFQGVGLDYSFSAIMTELLEKDSFSDDFWHPRKQDEEYMKSLKNRTGRLPAKLLASSISVDVPNIFIRDAVSNKTAYTYLIDLCSRLKWDIYIKDYGYLGLPTYRIYIPGVSEAFNINNMSILHLFSNMNKLHEIIDMIIHESKSRESLTKLFMCLVELYLMPRNKQYVDLSKLYGVSFANEGVPNYVRNIELMLFVLSNIIDKNEIFHKAKDIYSSLSKPTQLQKTIYVYLTARCNGVSAEEALSFIEKYAKPDVKRELISLMNTNIDNIVIPTCPFCAECRLSNMCCYNEWKKVVSILEVKINDYKAKYENLLDQSAI